MNSPRTNLSIAEAIRDALFSIWDELHFSATLIGVLVGVYAFAGILTRFAMPALLRRWRAERVMFCCLLFAAAVFAAFPLSTQRYFMLPMAFCLGLGLGCGQPLSMTIAYNRSPAGREGEVTGLRLTANNVSRVVIPPYVARWARRWVQRRCSGLTHLI
jgi:predicted MFS family arabinose efflux permease